LFPVFGFRVLFCDKEILAYFRFNQFAVTTTVNSGYFQPAALGRKGLYQSVLQKFKPVPADAVWGNIGAGGAIAILQYCFISGFLAGQTIMAALYQKNHT